MVTLCYGALEIVGLLLLLFSRIGLPNKIHSDRGSQFTSDMMREVYRLLNIKQSTVRTMPWVMGLWKTLTRRLKTC